MNVFGVSRVSRSESSGGWGNVEIESTVLGPPKVGDCEDSPRINRAVGDRNLDYIFTFVDRKGRRTLLEKWKSG